MFYIATDSCPMWVLCSVFCITLFVRAYGPYNLWGTYLQYVTFKHLTAGNNHINRSKIKTCMENVVKTPFKVISWVAGEHGKLQELEMSLQNGTCCWRQVLSLKWTETHRNFFKKSCVVKDNQNWQLVICRVRLLREKWRCTY